MQLRSRLGGAALVVLASSAAGSAPVLAQQPEALPSWPQSPQPASGRQVVPFMEGWYDNGDGTYTISFGYLNRNPDEVLDIPLGERNYIEPAKFDGRQPTHFNPSRNRGVFAITIPASERDQDVWWYVTGDDGQVYKVPGRTSAEAYQLDWMPRPHGSLPPLVWFGSESSAKRGPEGIWSDETLTTKVGQALTLSVSTKDDSKRDPEDPRFRNPLPVRVIWSKYQGPEGEVKFAHEPSMPEPPEAQGRRRGPPPGPDEVWLEGVAGTAKVIATFSAPGDYVMLAQSDNWRAPDSSSGDQCCWSNAYVRVTVAP